MNDTEIDDLVTRMLAEDLSADGDVTSSAVVPDGVTARGAFTARVDGVLAGVAVATAVLARVDSELVVTWSAHDGDALASGQTFGVVEGPLRSILTAERSALNVLTHASGIATSTRAYVDAVGSGTVVRDTRKTVPGLRSLAKAAVRAGGGQNHRMSLSDAVLVKDNHLVGTTVTDAVARARSTWPDLLLEVECDTVAQVAEAVEAGADLVLVDNMTPDEVIEAVRVVAGRVPIEVSGGVTLDTVSSYAETGADFVAVGAITHSAPSLDLGLDIQTLGDEPLDEAR